MTTSGARNKKTGQNLTKIERQDSGDVNYDANLLQRSYTQWQFGEWQKLAQLDTQTLKDHPDRASLALLAAAGRLQRGSISEARKFVRMARDWGCGNRLISQTLTAGVYNSLARAAAIAGRREQALKHFRASIAIGAPCDDAQLLSQARARNELQQLQLFHSNQISEDSEDQSIRTIYCEHNGYVSDKWDLYLSLYDQLFRPLKQCPVSLLEIGVQNGGSLQIWSKYFTFADAIVGCDIDEKCKRIEYESKTTTIVIGDIASHTTIDEIIAVRSSYDIIIDDGSHTSKDIINTFCSLFPFLKMGGRYVIEDLHCSYWGEYQGGIREPKSAICFLKALIDVVNHQHWGVAASRCDYLASSGFTGVNESTLSEIGSVTFFNSLCVITKCSSRKNSVGPRRVVGKIEPVASVKNHNGEALVVPDQSHNPTSSL